MQTPKTGDLCLLHAWFQVRKVVIYLHEEMIKDIMPLHPNKRDAYYVAYVVFLDDTGKLYKIPKNFVTSCDVLSAFEDAC